MLEQHRAGSRHDALLAVPPDEDNDAWMVSYIDIMTLLVALFVLLLTVSGQAGKLEEAFRQRSQASDAPSAWTMETPLPWTVPSPLMTSSGVAPPVIVPPRLAPPVPAIAPATVSDAAIAAAVSVASTGAVGVPVITPQAQAAAIEVASAPVFISQVAQEAALQAAQLTPRSMIAPLAIAAASEVAAGPPQEEMALPIIDGVEASRIEEGINLRIQDHLLFGSADATLTNAGREVIQRLVSILNQFEGRVSVEGHSDSRPISTPRFPSNWELSSLRATSILRYLVDAGIDPSRLRATGYADTQPIASNDTAQGRAVNRRVEVIIHETR